MSNAEIRDTTSRRRSRARRKFDPFALALWSLAATAIVIFTNMTEGSVQ